MRRIRLFFSFTILGIIVGLGGWLLALDNGGVWGDDQLFVVGLAMLFGGAGLVAYGVKCLVARG